MIQNMDLPRSLAIIFSLQSYVEEKKNVRAGLDSFSYTYLLSVYSVIVSQEKLVGTFTN